MVKQGDLLAIVDPRPYQVALEQAQGQLQQAQAQLKEAQVDLARYQTLASRTRSPSSRSTLRGPRQPVRGAGPDRPGGDRQRQAEPDLLPYHGARRRPGRPAAGRSGNYVTPGDANGLVVLTEIKPITVIFTLPEDNMPGRGRALHSGRQDAGGRIRPDPDPASSRREPDRDRQPGRSDDGDLQAPRAFSPTTTRASSQTSS